ncbi:hypothetical protein BLA29_000795, partial [Euroglyphus maynei]
MGNPIKLCSISTSTTTSTTTSTSSSTTTTTSSINDHQIMINQKDSNSNLNIKAIRSSMNRININQSDSSNLIHLDDNDDGGDNNINGDSNGPENSTGKTWSDLNFDQLLNDDDDDDNVLCKKRITSDCTKLPIEDVDLFGRGPDSEPLFTVKCKACNRLIKASAFRRHIDSINGFSQLSTNVMFNNNENLIKNGHIILQPNDSSNVDNTLTHTVQKTNTTREFFSINGLHNGKLYPNLTKSLNRQTDGSISRSTRRHQILTSAKQPFPIDDDDDVIEITNDINVSSSKSFSGEVEFLGPVNPSTTTTNKTSIIRRKNQSNNNQKQQQSSMFWTSTSNANTSGNVGGSNFAVIKGVYCGGNLSSGNQVLPISALHKSNGNNDNINKSNCNLTSIVNVEKEQHPSTTTTGQTVLKFHEIVVRSSNQSTTTTMAKSKDVNSILRTSTTKRSASELLSSSSGGNIQGNVVAKKSKPNNNDNNATSTTTTVAITAATTTSAGGQQQQVIMLPASMLSSITKQMVTNNETTSTLNGLQQQQPQILNNTTAISITTNCSTTSVSKMRSQPPSPMLMPPPPSPVVPKKRSIVLCKNREYDPDQHCGVQLANMERPCTRSLTCRSHMISLRRNVFGRSKPFDELLSEYKRERGMKERRERKPRNKSKMTTTISTSLSNNNEIAVNHQQLLSNGTIPSTSAIKRSLQAKISNNTRLSAKLDGQTNVIHKDKRINNDQR